MVWVKTSLSLCVFFALAGCKKEAAQSAASQEGSSAQPVLPSPGAKSLTDEAAEMALAFFRSHWQQCGDSYLSVVSVPARDDRFEEIKGLRPYMPKNHNAPLTEADRLNGLSWKGVFCFDYVAFRSYNQQTKQWSEWQAPGRAMMGRAGYWQIQVTNRDGKWEAKPWIDGSEYGGDEIAFHHPIDCEKAPTRTSVAGSPDREGISPAPRSLLRISGRNPDGTPLASSVVLLPVERNSTLVGLKVLSIVDGDLSQRFGLMPNDIVLRIGPLTVGDPVLSDFESAREILMMNRYSIVIERDGVEITLEPRAPGARAPIQSEMPQVGLTAPQEMTLGLQTAPPMAREMGGAVEPKDPRAVLVSEIGMKLLRGSLAAKSPYAHNFHYILLSDPKAVNAFALPGGQVFITLGLLQKLDNEAELVGVLGHETGHVIDRHSTQQIAKSALGQSLVASIDSGMSDALVTNYVNQMKQISFSREDEMQADTRGLQFMSEAGYDPRAMLSVIKSLVEISKDAHPPQMLQTHPYPEHRLQNIEGWLKRNYPNGVPSNLTLGRKLNLSAPKDF